MSTGNGNRQINGSKVVVVEKPQVGRDVNVNVNVDAAGSNDRPDAPELPPSEFFPDRSPGVRPIACNVPYSRNGNYEDRYPTVEDLRKALNDGGHAVVQAVHGQGGVGKTQLASEYLYQAAIDGTDYDVGWWVDCGLTDDEKGTSLAGEPPTLASEYAALAQKLPLPDKIKSAERTQDIVDAVRDWLETHDGWLLVFDNVVEERHIKPYLPKSSSGHVIITSRSSQWSSTVTPLQVEPFEPDVAREFLLKLSGSKDATSADALAEELGYLPLALAHAGHYVRNTPRSLAQYLADFRANTKKLLKRKDDLDEYEKTIFDTFDLSIRAVKERSKPAEALMSLCAFLARRDIPLFLLQDNSNVLPRSLQPTVRNADRLDEALRLLSQFGLIDIEDDAFSLHTLVHLIARERLTKRQSGRWIKAAVQLVNAAFPDEVQQELSTWPVMERLSSHGLTVADHASPTCITAASFHAHTITAPRETSRICNGLALYLKLRTMQAILDSRQDARPIHQAERLYCRALAIDELNSCSNHEVAGNLNNLAQLLLKTNRTTAAELLMRRVLEIVAQGDVENTEAFACALNNFGGLLQTTDRLQQAEPLFRRALGIIEQLSDVHQSLIAMRLNNLALLLSATDRQAESELLMRRALSICNQKLRIDHHYMAVLLTNLGRLLRKSNRGVLAEPLLRRGKEIFLACFEAENPKVQEWSNYHAELLAELEEFGLKTETSWTPEDVFRQLDEAGERHPISLVPLDQPVAPHLDELLGPAGSVEDVLAALDEQYRAEGRPPVWFLPLDEPISPHLDELLGPIDQASDE